MARRILLWNSACSALRPRTWGFRLQDASCRFHLQLPHSQPRSIRQADSRSSCCRASASRHRQLARRRDSTAQCVFCFLPLKTLQDDPGSMSILALGGRKVCPMPLTSSLHLLPGCSERIGPLLPFSPIDVATMQRVHAMQKQPRR